MASASVEPPRAAALVAGCGRAVIELPDEIFPVEGFSGVHDVLQARVLLLELGNRIAIVSVELTSLPHEQISALRDSVGAVAGLPPTNVWICVTHTLSAPHLVPKNACTTDADLRKSRLLWRGVKVAVNDAASRAVSGMTPARFGCETGFCDVNVNRDVDTADGWWLGCNETGPSDKSVTVLRFETLAGDPIALLFGYSVQSSVMDEPPAAGRTRLVTADLAGAASRFVEHEYGNAITAPFCMGAAGDQAPSSKGARFQYVGRNGRLRTKDVDERGFVIAEMLGARLGAEVLRVSEGMRCETLSVPIVAQTGAVRCPGQQMAMGISSLRPTRQYAFVPAEEREQPLMAIGLGDVALVGTAPELGCQTAMSIRERSPFSQTMVVTMVNGGAKYMADTTAYERITYEAMNSPFARGSAELLCEKVVELLHIMRK